MFVGGFTRGGGLGGLASGMLLPLWGAEIGDDSDSPLVSNMSAGSVVPHLQLVAGGARPGSSLARGSPMPSGLGERQALW